MKKYRLMLGLGVLSICWMTSVFASYSCQPDYGNVTVDNISCNRDVTLDETNVTGRVTVNGNLVANKAHINLLSDNGKVNMVNTTVDGVTRINGALSPTQSVFNGDMEINTHDLTLNSTRTKNIKMGSSKKYVRAVYLKDDSLVDGNITFQKGNGIVYVYSGSSITGQVIGGTVRYLK